MPDRPIDARQRTAPRRLLFGIVLALPVFTPLAIPLSQADVDRPAGLFPRDTW